LTEAKLAFDTLIEMIYKNAEICQF